jgi:PAS domain-containing protein
LVLTVEITFSGGAYSGGAPAYAFVCVIAGFLLGQRATIAALIACTVAYAGLAAAHATGHPPPQFFPSRPVPMLVFYGIFLLVFLGMLAFHAMRQALDAAHASELRFRRVIEQAVDGIIITDTAGRALLVNPALRDMFGFTSEAVGDLEVLSTYPPEE